VTPETTDTYERRSTTCVTCAKGVQGVPTDPSTVAEMDIAGTGRYETAITAYCGLGRALIGFDSTGELDAFEPLSSYGTPKFVDERTMRGFCNGPGLAPTGQDYVSPSPPVLLPSPPAPAPPPNVCTLQLNSADIGGGCNPGRTKSYTVGFGKSIQVDELGSVGLNDAVRSIQMIQTDAYAICEVQLWKNNDLGDCFCSLSAPWGTRVFTSSRFSGKDNEDQASSFTLSYGVVTERTESTCSKCYYKEPNCVKCTLHEQGGYCLQEWISS